VPTEARCKAGLTEQAGRHFVAGEELRLKRRYPEAAAEYARAYAACPDARILRNVHVSQDLAGEPVDAILSGLRYLAQADCARETEQWPLGTVECVLGDRQEVERALERLERKVGEIELEVESGVEVREVRVGGRVVPTSDFPVYLEPGIVEVDVFGPRPGDQRTHVVRVIAGERYPLYVGSFSSGETDTADPTPNPPVEPLPDPRLAAAERRREKAIRAAFWSSLGLTAASGVALATVGGITLHAYRRHQDRCTGSFDACEGAASPLANLERFERFKPATNAMIGVTAGLAMVTGILGIFAFVRRDRASQRASTTQLRTKPARVRAAWSTSGLTLRF
jgi:hypothetical protein